MTNDEIEAVLKVAFMECEAALCPLTEQQKKLLLQVFSESVRGESSLASAMVIRIAGIGILWTN